MSIEKSTHSNENIVNFIAGTLMIPGDYLFVSTSLSKHKSNVAPYDIRLAMAKEMFRDLVDFCRSAKEDLEKEGYGRCLKLFDRPGGAR